jgi:hypothetical protein
MLMDEPKDLLEKLPAQDAEHQVLANGIVIYSGPGWVQAFLAAGMNPTYGTIEHRVNGEQGAVMGPPRYGERGV